MLSALPLTAGLILTGCSATPVNNNTVNSNQVSSQPTNSTVDRTVNLGYAALIDVRTLEEWEAGHLEGAVRYGIESPDFVSTIITLDKSADYYIYCRSGNRAGQAIQIMREAGFTGDLVNGGAVENAAQELNLPIVK